MTNSEWLAALKEGDEVVIPRHLGSHVDMGKVTRTTPTQIHVGQRKYRRRDGMRIGGDSWTTHAIRPPTPEVREEVRRLRAVAGLLDAAREYRIAKVPTDRIEAALALLTADTDPSPPPPS